MANTGVSVIVCTFNGAERITETINHLANQIVPDQIHWEVILADNGSTDNSIEIAKAEWEKHTPLPLSIVKESQPGKLFALQKAVSTANYEYIIICDDDNWLASDYVAKVFQTLFLSPEISALGGFGFPAIKPGTTLPNWFAKYQYAYAVGPQAKSTGFLNPRKYLWGAGMATRRSVYLKIYEKHPSFLIDEKYKNILSSEDTEYCLRLSLRDYRLYYDGTLTYHHFISDERIENSYRDKLLQGFLNSDEILRKYHTALRMKYKTKGKPYMSLYLLITSLLMLLFTINKSKKSIAKDTIFYLLPLKGKKIDHRVKVIKEFSSL
ncbi:glycosyltransferase [Pedobacter sp. UYP24]